MQPNDNASPSTRAFRPEVAWATIFLILAGFSSLAIYGCFFTEKQNIIKGMAACVICFFWLAAAFAAVRKMRSKEKTNDLSEPPAQP
ncbi:MAG TPA: hypothetical protein VGP63_09640 [Planctomycetaceae bacterium]|jgi:hypothetical protein|nr:hypothetical protein [Planctomycetaceae bacterium]